MSDFLLPHPTSTADDRPHPSAVARSCLQIAAADTADLMAVAAVIASAFHPPGSWLAWFSPLLRLGIYQDLRQRLSQTAVNYACMITHNNQIHLGHPERVLGTVEISVRSVYLWDQQYPVNAPYLSNLAIHPQYRRQGIAHDLLLACEQTVRGWGFYDLYLHVLEDNQAARQLYRKLGYRIHQPDTHWGSYLLGQPRQLLLHKSLLR